MSRKPRLARRAALGACRALSNAELSAAWAAYYSHRDDPAFRNRLVEHYLPAVYDFALGTAHHMHLGDVENAVGEVLSALITSIVPDYHGRGDFLAWARVCVQRLLISLRRRDRLARSLFTEPLSAADESSLLARRPAPPAPSDEPAFLQITAGLSDAQAAILWLKFQRGVSYKKVGEALGIETEAARVASFRAISLLRKKFLKM